MKAVMKHQKKIMFTPFIAKTNLTTIFLKLGGFVNKNVSTNKFLQILGMQLKWRSQLQYGMGRCETIQQKIFILWTTVVEGMYIYEAKRTIDAVIRNSIRPEEFFACCIDYFVILSFLFLLSLLQLKNKRMDRLLSTSLSLLILINTQKLWILAG